MRITQAQSGMFNRKVLLGDFFGVEKDKAFLEVSEWSIGEMQKLRSLPTNDEKTDFVLSKLPEKITGHNFDNEDGTACTKEQILNLLRVGMVDRIMQEVMAVTPSQAASVQTSGQSQPPR